MKTIARNAGAEPRTSRRTAVLVSAALLALAPIGVLMSQETSKPTTPPAPAQPAATQPAAKKTETPAKPATQAGTPAATTAGKTPPAQAAKTSPTESAKPAGADEASGDNAGAVDESQAPKRFIPTQKSSADNSATFPIDI